MLIVVEKFELHCTMETGRGGKHYFYAFLAIIVYFSRELVFCQLLEL